MINAESRARIEARRRSQERRKWKSIIVILGILGVGSAAVLGVSAWNKSNLQANYLAEYTTGEVVVDQPFEAVHEMTGDTLASIPFLPEGGPQPQISVTEAFFDFGSIGPTDIVEHDFVITNLGDAPLTISRAYTTCGCTTAEFTSSVIPPGKQVVVTLILNAGFHDVRGQTVRRGVIIENNDPASPQFELWTEAAVRTE
jgi:hypothetical protein